MIKNAIVYLTFLFFAADRYCQKEKPQEYGSLGLNNINYLIFFACPPRRTIIFTA